MSRKLYIVIPCYNEEAVLEETTKRLSAKLKELIEVEQISPESRILYVDDGSGDRTWELIEGFYENSPFVCGIRLAHNRGHQNALFAGLMYAKEFCDCSISMDSDLQDDILVIDGFLAANDNGDKIVYGVRRKRDKDSFFKRASARGFYRFLKFFGVDIIYDHADCRLMDKDALEALSEYGEVNLFLRGIVPMIGLRHSIIYYDRKERFAGESKYPLKKMIHLGMEGLTSFSIRPLRLISALGGIMFLISIISFLLMGILGSMGYGASESSYLIATVLLIGSIQILCLGICGEYIGKIYGEVKKRPRYFVETFLNK